MLDTLPQASILLVDDLPANLLALEALLAPSGHRLVKAASGQEALRCALLEDFAVILMDVRLGDMSGIEVTAMLRDRERTRHTPVLLLTAGSSDDRELLEGYAHGAVDYLRKPLVTEVLRAKVAVFVDLFRARESVRRHEERLRAQEREALKSAHREQIHHLLMQAPAGITILRGPDFIFEFSNALNEKIVGRRIPMGKPLLEVIPEFADEPEAVVGLRRVLETGKPFQGSELSSKWDRHGTGQRVESFFNLYYEPMRDEYGHTVGVLTFSVEVTEQVLARRKAERLAAELNQLNAELEHRVRERTAQLEEANQELESFSYSVSHDLRAPLRHITGFAQLLSRKVGANLDDTSRGFLETIIHAAQQGGTLIDDLLSFSRMSRAELHKQTVDLRKVMEAVRLELASDAAGRAVEWRIGELPRVKADPALLRQVVRNLLANALKYTRPKPHALIEVGARQTDEDVEVWVRDNGVGFEMEYVDKLFGVFQRLHSPDEFEGTGIGLANVRRIIARHGGRTWAEGRLGEGATFHFSLPRGSSDRKDEHSHD
ncbi:ATP-binding protein [Hyalangium versicolor]|uniref:ATP-binding protein n=1 Tax=Hyalangium versicolor TaxID=2861190 RepID=UPI001CC92087|nr:ATP-binding protein [Hyalangium versicolor]